MEFETPIKLHYSQTSNLLLGIENNTGFIRILHILKTCFVTLDTNIAVLTGKVKSENQISHSSLSMSNRSSQESFL